jgi:DNA-binding NtrC family response regulator
MAEVMGKKVLVVDDDPDSIEILTILLKNEGCEVVSAANGFDALKEVKSTFFTVILLDIHMPGMDGIEVLGKLKEESPQSLVMILTAYKSDENIKKAYKANVFDFINKPIENKLLLLKIKRAFEHADALLKSEQAKKEILVKYPFEKIIGASPRIREIFRIIGKVAPTDICVSIVGETGTGKELVARAIHATSKRTGPFIPVNVGALPETLLENELFGHEKGSFTDAKERRFGYFESCKDGTIFLDEISEISPKMQVSLLRVLQEKKIIRVGGKTEIDVNPRVITATNKHLEKLVEKGTFRKDLYYRIKTVTIPLPPLRERREDINLLVDHFMKKHSNKDVVLSDEAAEILLNYNYPGNVRELEHIIERALIFKENNIILPHDLPPELTGKSKANEFSEIFKLPWREAKQLLEKRYIENKLEKTNGNISEAARISGIDRSDLHKKIEKMGLKKSNKQG